MEENKTSTWEEYRKRMRAFPVFFPRTCFIFFHNSPVPFLKL